MKHSPSNGSGGTFCQFTVGSGQRGASCRHLRYIANPQAVRDGREGIWLQGFPPLLSEAPYPVLVSHLCDWAHWLEQEEHLRHKGRGTVRTHYQAILSFEVPLSILQAKSLLAAWTQEAFPRAQTAAFVHSNTAHLHTHIWIAARQTDGRKINLSARTFRQLDEKWNCIYCCALDRDAREHLLKKGQTERWKQLRREGKAQDLERPARVAQGWKEGMFNDRERERLGANLPGYDHLAGDPAKGQPGEWEKREDKGREDDRHESRTGTDQPRAASNAFLSETGEPGLAGHQPPDTPETAHVQQLLADAQQTLSAVNRLRHDAQRMAAREPEQQIAPLRERDVEPERER